MAPDELWQTPLKTGPEATILFNNSVTLPSTKLYENLTTTNTTTPSASPFSSVDALSSHLGSNISKNRIIYYNLFNIFSNGGSLGATINYAQTLGKLFEIPNSLAWSPMAIAGKIDEEHPFSKVDFSILNFTSLAPDSLQKLADSFAIWYKRISNKMDIPNTSNSMLSLGLSPYLVLNTATNHYNILENGAANPAGLSPTEKLDRFNNDYNLSATQNATIELNNIPKVDKVELIQNLTHINIGSVSNDIVFKKGITILCAHISEPKFLTN